MVIGVKEILIKAFNIIRCLFGYHKWDREDVTFRECSLCGRQEIRIHTAPDGFLSDWRENYR